MTRVNPEDRKRVRVPKVRTGCKTCKPWPVRRVKCDEAKPFCEKCTSTGRKCDGYAPPPLDSSLVLRRPHDLDLIRVGTTLGSGQEARHFQYFHEKTMLQLETFFPDDLWSKCILQVAHTESCIRHAVVALSAYHERYVADRIHGDVNVFALKQYNLAIKGLVGEDGLQKPPHIHLLSCLIFICIEILQGKHPSAVRLFRHGYTIIRESRQGNGNGIPAAPSRQKAMGTRMELQDVIRPVEKYFHRLAVQIMMLLGDVAPEIPPSLIIEYLRSDLPQSPSFKSLSEARESLLELVLGGFNVAAMNEAEHAAYNQRIDMWSRAFETLVAALQRRRPLNVAETRTVALLRAHMQNAAVNLNCCPPGTYGADLMVWDQFTLQFSKIIDNAAIATGRGQDNVPRTVQPVFHMELGIITILISVAGKCREPLIRRKAIELMQGEPIQEGIWSSALTAKVALRVVEMEEAGRVVRFPWEIPAEARLRQLRVRISPEDRRAEVLYGFLHGSHLEVLEWQ